MSENKIETEDLLKNVDKEKLNKFLQSRPIILEIKQYTEENQTTDEDIGYEVITNKGTIYLMLSGYADCCEDFGIKAKAPGETTIKVDPNAPSVEDLYLETADDLSRFIGETIVSIEALTINNRDDKWCEEENESMLKIKTDKDEVTFSVYNNHNGYYAHCGFLLIFDEKCNFSL